jgi:hypothetical protein
MRICMKKQVGFHYKLQGTGKAVAQLSLWDKHVDFELTNASNPLTDLLNGIGSLILEPSHMWGEDNSAWIEWYGDTAAWRWLITTTDGNHLHITLTHTPDLFDDATSQTVLEGECTLDQLLLAVVAELDGFIKTTGLLNYVQQWQKEEFPISALLFLKKQLIDKNLWQPNHQTGDTLRLEMDLLLQ